MQNSCPFCQGRGSYIHKKDQRTIGGDFRTIYKCRECSALYPYPRMTSAESSAHLSAYPTNKSDYKFCDPTGAVSRRDPLVKILRRYTKCRGNALDIGTFEGRFCFILGSLGFKAYGIEPQENVVRFAKKHGIEVFLGSFPGAVPQELCQRKYDLISVMESIYYFDDMKKTLRMINTMLTDDGRLLIKAHQGHSRYYDACSYFSRYGDSVQCIPTLKSLRYYLQMSGFKIVRIVGETSLDLLPLGMSRIRNTFLGKAVKKIYNSMMLEWTLLDIGRADRLIVVAKKI